MLYEMLTGELPVSRARPRPAIAQHLAVPPRSMRAIRPELSENLERAVLSALAKQPGERPGSACGLVRSLSDVK